MFNTASVHSRVFELERELISAKADFVTSKTLRTKLGTVAIDWVTAVASAVVLSSMAVAATFTAFVSAVSLVIELFISIVALVEFFCVSVIKMFETLFLASVTVWAIICSLIDDLVEVEDDQMSPMSPRVPVSTPPPPPSPLPSPPASPLFSNNSGFLELRDLSGGYHTTLPLVYKAPIEDVCRGLPYTSKEQKREARIARRASRF